MDTRTKIQPPGAASALPPGALVVSGSFDPLLAAHAEELVRLSQGACALAVVIEEPPQPILPARARAELVAALACVTQVYLAGDGAPAPAVSLGQEHLRRRGEFVEHLRSRQI
ncbi:MAG: hypothetical protein HY821_12575 [Acidobacteria bacterium]|nr:hypothetical protein [Acidobacteriota bacterium]